MLNGIFFASNNNRISPNGKNIKVIFICAVVILYFIWMDIALYYNLQQWQPFIDPSKFKITKTPQGDASQLEKFIFDSDLSDNVNGFKTTPSEVSVFNPLTVKLIMIDHISHYIQDTLARFIEDFLHLTDIFPWMTPNFVSFTGITLSIISAKFLLSDKLEYRRIGCILFEIRNLCDSLDGVVFRAREKRHHTYETLKGTFGYNIDAFSDGFGGVVFFFAIFIRFLRNPPRKNLKFLPVFRCSSSSDNQIEMNSIENSNHVDSNSSSLSPLLLNMESDSDMKSVKKTPNSSSVSPKLFDSDIPFSHKSEKFFFNPIKNFFKSIGMWKNENNNPSESYNHLNVSRRQVKLIVVLFGMRLLCTALLWDHFTVKYHELLEVYGDNPAQINMQVSLFKQTDTWILLWFWRLGSACGMLEHLVIVTFFDIVWEYMVFSSYICWFFLIILPIFTQIHYTEMAETLMRTGAHS